MTEILENDEVSREILNPEPSDEIQPKLEENDAGCSKPKKGRRGKKKRNKSQDNEDNKGSDESGSKKDERISKTREGRKRSKLLIRPTDVPKAPENSTQFIIDDHDECHLYFSFETPNPYKEKVRSDSSDIYNDAALQDIDYEYESMQDLDNTAYYLQDFELSYSKVRYEETMRLTKPDLVTALENLEARVRELEHKMYEKDPGSALEQLQRKLLRLQEENIALREEQQHLRKTVVGEESGSDLLQDSESEHSQNSDNDEQDMNDVLFESSDAYSVLENEDDVEYSDSNNELSSDDVIEKISSDEAESIKSVSSVIYGLRQEYDNLPDDNTPEHEMDFSENSSDIQYIINEVSLNSSSDEKSETNYVCAPNENAESDIDSKENSNDSLLIKTNGIRHLGNNENVNSNSHESQVSSDSETLQCNKEQSHESPIEQIQEVPNTEQLNVVSSAEQLQNNCIKEELQETSQFALDSNEKVQSQCSNQLKCDTSSEPIIAENCKASQEQLLNVNSEPLQEVKSEYFQDINNGQLKSNEHLEDTNSEHLQNKSDNIYNECEKPLK